MFKIQNYLSSHLVFQGHPFISGGWWRLKMTSQDGRWAVVVVVGVQRPDWLLSGTLLMDNSISLFFLICHNFEIQVIFFVVTHDRGLAAVWDTFYGKQYCQVYYCLFEYVTELEIRSHCCCHSWQRAGTGARLRHFLSTTVLPSVLLMLVWIKSWGWKTHHLVVKDLW